MKHRSFVPEAPAPAKPAITAAMASFVVLVLVLAASATPQSIQPGAVPFGDAASGKELFARRCGGCHSLDSDKEGPRLRGVYGRKAGSISTFRYSNALQSAAFTWDAASLDRWLTNTESVVPDNDMDFHVPKAKERADIIAFLRSSSLL
jgi:cytochrome c